MSSTISAADVTEIMDNCGLSDSTVAAYIDTAETFVDEVFSEDTYISDDLLLEIKKWFAAHMIAATTWRTTESEKIGDAQVKYTGKWGMYLDGTPYGQMVKILDTTGKMGKVGKRQATLKAIVSFSTS